MKTIIKSIQKVIVLWQLCLSPRNFNGSFFKFTWQFRGRPPWMDLLFLFGEITDTGYTTSQGEDLRESEAWQANKQLDVDDAVVTLRTTPKKNTWNF